MKAPSLTIKKRQGQEVKYVGKIINPLAPLSQNNITGNRVIRLS
jgi:hypothetical protein